MLQFKNGNPAHQNDEWSHKFEVWHRGTAPLNQEYEKPGAGIVKNTNARNNQEYGRHEGARKFVNYLELLSVGNYPDAYFIDFHNLS